MINLNNQPVACVMVDDNTDNTNCDVNDNTGQFRWTVVALINIW